MDRQWYIFETFSFVADFQKYTKLNDNTNTTNINTCGINGNVKDRRFNSLDEWFTHVYKYTYGKDKSMFNGKLLGKQELYSEIRELIIYEYPICIEFCHYFIHLKLVLGRWFSSNDNSNEIKNSSRYQHVVSARRNSMLLREAILADDAMDSVYFIDYPNIVKGEKDLYQMYKNDKNNSYGSTYGGAFKNGLNALEIN